MRINVRIYENEWIDKLELFEISIPSMTYSDLLTLIERKIEKCEKCTMGYVNAHVFLLLNKLPPLKQYMIGMSLLYPDGTGIYLADKLISGKDCFKERINGTDLYPKILQLAVKKKYKVFFFGGSDYAAQKMTENLKIEFPGICIAGISKWKLEFDETLIQEINNSMADILFVGLGTPYQEKFISEYSGKINAPVQITVGSGLEFLAGTEKRAPLFLRNFWLEWLYRLIQNPKRLSKRYFLGIPEFIYRILVYKIKT